MKVKQFRYSSDNLGYLIYSDQNAVAIDGGAVDDILSFLKSNKLNLKYITNTHSHGDHTVGNKRLLEKSEAEYIDSLKFVNKGIELDGSVIWVYSTPGHTSDSLIFKTGNNLITGDTLFIGKVGKCFSGDLKGFFDSIKLIMQFPDNTVIYPGHDYVEEYMGFVRILDPDNKYVEKILKNYNPELIKSSLGHEKRLNPFLRLNEEKIMFQLEKRGLPVRTEYDRWQAMISLM